MCFVFIWEQTATCATYSINWFISYLPVKKFPVFYGTRRFITAFTSARHLSLSWASSIQSIPPHSTSWRSILILSSHLRLGFSSGHFPSRFPTNSLYAPLTHTRYMPLPSQYSRFYYPNNIGWGPHYVVYSTSLLPRSLRPKYSPQHPILKHPQPTFLPQCERPSFTPLQNNRKR